MSCGHQGHRRKHAIYYSCAEWKQKYVQGDRVLKPFIDAGYKIVGISVNTHPDVAVLRGKLRFLVSGRFASEAYIRSSFPEPELISELFHTHTLISCTNDCRDLPGSVLSRAFNSHCLQCDQPLNFS